MTTKTDTLDALKRETSKSLELYHGDVARVIDHLAQRGMIVKDGWVAVPTAWAERHGWDGPKIGDE